MPPPKKKKKKRSEELVRGMRARSLMQVYRTLLASVEYARLPEGLDYDEVRCCLKIESMSP